MFWDYFTAGAAGGASFGLVVVGTILLIIWIGENV